MMSRNCSAPWKRCLQSVCHYKKNRGQNTIFCEGERARITQGSRQQSSPSPPPYGSSASASWGSSEWREEGGRDDLYNNRRNNHESKTYSFHHSRHRNNHKRQCSKARGRRSTSTARRKCDYSPRPWGPYFGHAPGFIIMLLVLISREARPGGKLHCENRSFRSRP